MLIIINIERFSDDDASAIREKTTLHSIYVFWQNQTIKYFLNNRRGTVTMIIRDSTEGIC